jgi:hypothetical protein
MRRRFGRDRRTGNANAAKGAPVDAKAWLQRIVESDLTDAAALEPVSLAGVPESYAALGAGERRSGGKILVAISPRSGGEAALAALVLGSWHGSGEGRGELLAVSPRWSGASRRLLSVLRALPMPLRAVALSAPGAGPSAVEPEPLYVRYAADPRRIAELITRADQRQLFLRALAALEGLAAKHGGAVRSAGPSVELVLLARRVATLSASQDRIELETRLPDSTTCALDAARLSTLLDRLEGLLRKKLNERKIRSSEERLRANLLPILERAADARWSAIWPLPGGDSEVIDLAAVRGDGSLLLAAARRRLDLTGLGPILEAALSAEPVLAALAARAAVPVQPGAPELILAAQEFDGAALTALGALRLPCRAFDVRASRSGELSLEPRAALAPATAPRAAAARAAPAAQAESAARSPREETRSEAAPAKTSPRQYEEISLFDLDDDAQPQAEAGEGAGSRRRRGRRRGRRGHSGEAGDAAPERAQEAEASQARDAEPRRGARAGRRSLAPPEDEEPRAAREQEPDEELMLEAEDEDDTLAPLSEDAPDLEDAEEVAYDEEDDLVEVEAEEDLDARPGRAPRERVDVAEVAPVVEPEAPPRPPRRRSAFVAHADRSSVLSAILLARDVRLVEGFWIYPQDELMTFFRSIATDLREETPIFLVGFTAAPLARDTLQAASLYRGRLDWFDHHTWPPEDLQALRAAVGEDSVHVQPGTESSVAGILAQRTRRSRFSDKLVELITGRFTRHDYERWGRLWWHRASELASTPGERRGEIDPLLAGRPSDLARQAASLPLPSLPQELDYVSGHDFRLVHFGGYTMVVTPVPPELDLHLTARIARERYEVQLSLAYREGEEMVVLGGDEGRSRRGLDLGGMVSHLVAKHEWIEALPDDDHVARIRVIAMGRSIVEG